MRNLLNNHVVRLIAGNLAAVLLVVGLPTVVVLRTVGQWDGVTSMVAALACVHVLILSVEVAATGQPVPRKWNAACFAVLPVLDAAATVSLLQAGQFGWAAVCLMMTAIAALVVVLIALRTWRRMRTQEQVVLVTRPAPTPTHSATVMEDEHPMVF